MQAEARLQNLDIFCFQKGYSPLDEHETLFLLNLMSRFFHLVAFICEF